MILQQNLANAVDVEMRSFTLSTLLSTTSQTVSTIRSETTGTSAKPTDITGNTVFFVKRLRRYSKNSMRHIRSNNSSLIINNTFGVTEIFFIQDSVIYLVGDATYFLCTIHALRDERIKLLLP